MKRILSILFALALVLSLGVTTAPPLAAADSGHSFQLGTAVINVPEDYETIQEAVDAAVPGNVIVVAAGEYDGFQVLGKQNISIVSTEGATVTSGKVTSINRGPIEDALSMAAVKDSQDIIISGIGFNGAGLDEEDVVAGIAYVNSTGRVVNLTVENIIGAQLGAGVAIIGDEGASRVDLLGVTVNNSMAGVIVWEAEADLDGCTITGMKPGGGFGLMATGAGIVIGIPGEPWSGPSNVKVKGSTVSDNDSVGIYVCDGSVLEAHFNRIVGNTQFGVVNDGAEVVDARHNWWGGPGGPLHSTNPGGVGNNAVSDGVTFEPWTESRTVVKTVIGEGSIDAKEDADTEVYVRITNAAMTDGSALDTNGNGLWEVITTWGVRRFPGNPRASNPSMFVPLSHWVDVALLASEIPEGTDIEIEIRFYYKDQVLELLTDDLISKMQLMWWNGQRWSECKDRGLEVFGQADDDGYRGFIWVKIRQNTIPPLSYLQTSEFGGYAGPTEVGPICGGGLSSAIPVGLLCVVCGYLSLRQRYGKRDRHAAGGQ